MMYYYILIWFSYAFNCVNKLLICLCCFNFIKMGISNSKIKTHKVRVIVDCISNNPIMNRLINLSDLIIFANAGTNAFYLNTS